MFHPIHASVTACDSIDHLKTKLIIYALLDVGDIGRRRPVENEDVESPIGQKLKEKLCTETDTIEAVVKCV